MSDILTIYLKMGDNDYIHLPQDALENWRAKKKTIESRISRLQNTRDSLVKESSRKPGRNIEMIFPNDLLIQSKFPEIFYYDEYEEDSDDESYICSDEDYSGSDWSEDEEEEELEDTEKP